MLRSAAGDGVGGDWAGAGVINTRTSKKQSPDRMEDEDPVGKNMGKYLARNEPTKRHVQPFPGKLRSCSCSPGNHA